MRRRRSARSRARSPGREAASSPPARVSLLNSVGNACPSTSTTVPGGRGVGRDEIRVPVRRSACLPTRGPVPGDSPGQRRPRREHQRDGVVSGVHLAVERVSVDDSGSGPAAGVGARKRNEQGLRAGGARRPCTAAGLPVVPSDHVTDQVSTVSQPLPSSADSVTVTSVPAPTMVSSSGLLDHDDRRMHVRRPAT